MYDQRLRKKISGFSIYRQEGLAIKTVFIEKSEYL